MSALTERTGIVADSSASVRLHPSLRPWSHVEGSISKTALAVTAKITDPYRRRPRHERPVGLGRCRQADSEFRPSVCACLGLPLSTPAWVYCRVVLISLLPESHWSIETIGSYGGLIR